MRQSDLFPDHPYIMAVVSLLLRRYTKLFTPVRFVPPQDLCALLLNEAFPYFSFESLTWSDEYPFSVPPNGE